MITTSECEITIKNMKNGRSPGPDGNNVEFYKMFWHDIKSDLIDALNFLLENNCLS